jgi:HEAT repeat protein
VDFLGRNENHSIQFEAAWAITNIASGTTEHVEALIAAGALPPLIALLSSPNDDLQEQAVWAVGNVSVPECCWYDVSVSECHWYTLG